MAGLDEEQAIQDATQQLKPVTPRRVEAGVLCIRCRYALESLERTSRCPECGTSVHLSTGRRRRTLLDKFDQPVVLVSLRRLWIKMGLLPLAVVASDLVIAMLVRAAPVPARVAPARIPQPNSIGQVALGPPAPVPAAAPPVGATAIETALGLTLILIAVTPVLAGIDLQRIAARTLAVPGTPRPLYGRSLIVVTAVCASLSMFWLGMLHLGQSGALPNLLPTSVGAGRIFGGRLVVLVSVLGVIAVVYVWLVRLANHMTSERLPRTLKGGLAASIILLLVGTIVPLIPAIMVALLNGTIVYLVYREQRHLMRVHHLF